MKKKLLSISMALLALALPTGADERPNLVPSEPASAPNYWCTWYAQNYWIGRGSDLTSLKGVTNQAAREELTYQTVFDAKEGWATSYLPRGREDYIFLIDHGWQTKQEEERIAGGPAFFNMITDPRDFPPYAELHPKERLKQFNEDIKALGWNSLGLWVRGNITEEQARTFVEWSRYAGITYWKIDGGNDGGNYFSTRAKEELYPELMLEYITGAGGNINPKWNEELSSYPSVYDFGGKLRNAMLEMVQNTDVFRTYDASPLLMSSTTLRRTHDILKQTQQQSKYRAVLNVQDDCNVAVGLGVLVASKRHPNRNERTYQGKDLHHQLSGPRRMQERTNEAERFGRWARIAPAFPAGEGVYLASEEELIDRCEFTEWDTWASATYGKMVSQSAPAIMARNMPLPKVESEGPTPFVCATTYPNGATGIATEGRVSSEKRWFEPRARVSVMVKDASQPVGIVGRYQDLELEFAGSIESVDHVWAQDLLAESAEDIRNEIRIEGHRLIIPGTLIDRIGTSAGDEGDLSAPGMVLKLEGPNLPAAGEDFTPAVKIPEEPKPVAVESNGFAGTARVVSHPYGYQVQPAKRLSGQPSFALQELSEPILSGKATITWKMKSLNLPAGKRNGFVVLSSDEQALSSIFAGAWTGAKKLSIFEGVSGHTEDTQSPIEPNGELVCQLELDMDARTIRTTINGVSKERAFSESVTSINSIGFGVLNANTLFTEPEVVRN
ncbi:MAG: hypothetical protein Q7Q71_16020 [Verrucomicrobiota bacterium JB023]|nr:hypothetical protein [Verrucomicrobiota bacterium JB023]